MDRGLRSPSSGLDLGRRYARAHRERAFRKPLQDQSASAFHDSRFAAYWTRQTRGFDWSQEDRVPAVLFKQILWKGLTGGLPFPAARDQQDLSPDRVADLKARSVRFLFQGQ
jgi:hypothetical protein